MKQLQEGDWSKIVQQGSHVFIGSGAACPHALVNSMLAQAHQLRDIEIFHILTLGPTPWADFDYERHLRINAFFLGENVRDAVNAARADYTPCFLSEIPQFFTKRIIPLEVALIMVSPPDMSGNCSLGVSVDIVSAARKSADIVVAQINPMMPKTFGDTWVHEDEIDYFIEHTAPLPELFPTTLDKVSQKIGRYVAQLVEDGSTLQLGIGKIPDAICQALKNHQNLGLHSEMLGDGAMELLQLGVINNSLRTLSPNKSTISFCAGSQQLYEYVNNNPDILFFPSDQTNNPLKIAQNEKMVSINSALQVDLTGQVVADSMGSRFYSGIGGQVDFIRGAALSKDGKAIIALPSTALQGTQSRIVAELDRGTGVVTSRGDVQYVVTEYGIATLRGRSIRERTLELIQIAHPKFRQELLNQARENCWLPNYQSDTPSALNDLEGLESKKVTFSDSNYILRTLRPSDQRNLQEFFYSHSEETIRMRYAHNIKDMNQQRAYRLVNIDQEKDLALAIIELQGPRQVIHAVGRYYLDEAARSAEFAIVVKETTRRLGMASKLMFELIRIAKKRGSLDDLSAFILKENQAMQELIKKLGGHIEATEDPNSIKATFVLGEVELPAIEYFSLENKLSGV